jgi:hypothetical protein
MIQLAAELRLLNRVYGPDKCVLTVLEITESGITYDCEHFCCEFIEWDKIEPIPLTEDIISKIPGAKEWVAASKNRSRHEDEPDPGDDAVYALELTTVHQLQNRYYSLFGKEFPIRCDLNCSPK